MPVAEVVASRSKRLQIALAWAVGHVPPLVLDARRLCASRVLWLSWVDHVDLGEVRLELVDRLHSILLDHILVVVVGRLHVANVGVASEGLAAPAVLIPGAHLVLNYLHVVLATGVSDIRQLQCRLALVSVEANLVGIILASQMRLVLWLIVSRIIALNW